MKLYNFWRSTAATRVRIALNLKGLNIAHEEIDLFAGAHQEPAFLALNPQAMVPALALDDGTLLTQSLAIIDYLDAIAPTPLLTPTDPILKAKVQAAAYAVAIDIHPITSMAISSRVEALKPGHRMQWILDVMALRLPMVETLLGREKGPYAFGAQVTLADLCLVAQLYNARDFGLDLTPYPRLREIDAACLALPAFQTAMPRDISQPSPA